MPGLRKDDIARKVSLALEFEGARSQNGRFAGEHRDLPWEFDVRFADGTSRTYRTYFWTVSHGGRNRPESEFRIQAKLKVARSLEFATGTTLLLGYFSSRHSPLGHYADAQNGPKDMEIFVAWDPLQHLRVGRSSSCQVKYEVLQEAYVLGLCTAWRRTSYGQELVVAMRPEHFARYLRAAAGGHNNVDVERLTV